MPTTRPALSAKASRDRFCSVKSLASGAAAMSSAPKVYCRIDQVKRKNA